MDEKTNLNWFCKTETTEFGPMTSSALHKLIKIGQLKPMDFVRRANSTEWREAKQVTSLAKLFQNEKLQSDEAYDSLDAEEQNTGKSWGALRKNRLLLAMIGGLVIVILAVVIILGGISSDPANNFEDFKNCISVKNENHYFRVKTTSKFPTGEVQWEGTLKGLQDARSGNWLLEFSDFELPQPLELRFHCTSDEVKDWVSYIGVKTKFKATLPDKLIAGYGGPPMYGDQEEHKRIVFELIDPYALKARNKVDVLGSQMLGGGSSQKQVRLSGLFIQLHSLVPIPDIEESE